MPLAIPSYITAYAYAGFFDYVGFFEKITGFRVDIMNIYGLIFILSISLYPYVFVASRAFFVNQSNNIIEASKILGASERKTFFKLDKNICDRQKQKRFKKKETAKYNSTKNN